MWTKTFASKVLRDLSEARRRVISDWRILFVARKLAHTDNAPLPNEKKALEIRNELLKRGDIIPADGVAGVYIVDVAYANLLVVSEEQIVQEANPWAVFGFLTAMTYHGITDLVTKTIFAITSPSHDRNPLGTMPEDWSEKTDLLTARRPDKVGNVAVNWTKLGKEPGFGVMVGYSFGIPIYLTDIERTLIDALRMPDKSGGIAKILQAWRSAEDWDVAKLVAYTDAYDNQVLRQRVGYLLDRLGKVHPRIDEWRHGLQRGGSVKLVASNPYSEIFSPEWNLSLNVAPTVLAIIEGNET